MSDPIGVRVGVVDVFVLRRRDGEWDALCMQRAEGVRCPGAWEAVHGSIEPGERAEDAAVREVEEETGLAVERLYNVTVQPFYLHVQGVVMLAVVFAAVVRDGPLTLSAEHTRAEWLPGAVAASRYAWPSERANVRQAVELLAGGDGGDMEDVLRVR
ncbi:MAG: NUDIX domain-containing protein [Gemmatimonadaceae bacterium]